VKRSLAELEMVGPAIWCELLDMHRELVARNGKRG
jgi:hypothetical protein